MTVVLDTSVLVGLLNADDPRHKEAKALMKQILAGAFGVPVASDCVLDEGLTLLRRRPGRAEVSRAYAAFFLPEGERPAPLQVRSTTKDDLVRAARLHFERYDRGLSFTDCVLAAVAQDLNAPVASFDAGFDGIVPRIAGPR